MPLDRRSLMQGISVERRRWIEQMSRDMLQRADEIDRARELAQQIETGELLAQIERERAEMREQLTTVQVWFAKEIAALRAQLEQTRAKLHRLQMLDLFANADRDWGALLH